MGVQYNNINISPVEGDQYNLFMVTLMMVLDCLIYAILVWYIEHIHPGRALGGGGSLFVWCVYVFVWCVCVCECECVCVFRLCVQGVCVCVCV